MKKFGRDKIALFLACASILGGKAQAMDKNKPQSRQAFAAVGGADKKSSQGFVNWVKNHKWQLAVGGTLTAAAAVTLTVLGVKYWGKKDSGGDPNEKGNNPIKDKNIIDQKDLGTKDNDSDPNKEQDIQNIKEVNDNSDGNQIIENKNNGDESGNSKKDLNIKNKIKIEEQIQLQNAKELEEQNKSNFQLINDIIIKQNLGGEEDNKQKDLIIKAFKYLAETLNGKSVVEVLKLDILDKFSDDNYNNYFENNSAEAIAKNFGGPIQELLDFFSNKSEISITDSHNYKVNVGSGINLCFSLGNKAKIALRNKIEGKFVEIEYDSSQKGEYNSCSHIYFKIPHNLLNKN